MTISAFMSALKRHFFIALGSITILAVGVARLANTPACGYNYKNDRQLLLTNQTIKLENVSGPAVDTQVLSGRPCMAYDQGLVYDFPKPGIYSISMKDMRFNLDIVWLDTHKKVVELKTNAQPASYPEQFKNKQPAQYVLELAAGSVAQRDIRPGNTLTF